MLLANRRKYPVNLQPPRLYGVYTSQLKKNNAKNMISVTNGNFFQILFPFFSHFLYTIPVPISMN